MGLAITTFLNGKGEGEEGTEGQLRKGTGKVGCMEWGER